MRVSFYHRTSANYQSQQCGIELEVLEGWTPEQVMEVCRYYVFRELGEAELGKIPRTTRQQAKLYHEYFGEHE